ncbi:MAG: M14 family metallopeptidase [Sedimentisphaerales bacterium]|nr:M14 family metallopeptidase [Sedimentisphaerales bacterium]
MRRKKLLRLAFLFYAAYLLFNPGHSVAEQIQSPETFMGHKVGEDYKVARYEKIREYFQHVSANSRRVNVRKIGLTTEGREMVIAEITEDAAPEQIQQAMADQMKIADPRLIKSQKDERSLIANAKVVVLINCNLHSTELASSQMAMELLYDLATGSSPEIQDILKRTIIVLIPSANPDGLNKVIDWYERSLGKPWEGTGMPWLYQKYAGHDNNRDWFMLNLKETRLETKVIYKEWLPNIIYDIHQMGNSGARFFVPPFFDPKNPNVHPLNDHMMLIIGGHIAAELTRESKKGILNSAMYDNWWQGGFRTSAYRHNVIGILTEAASVLIASPIFQRKSELRGSTRGMPDYAIATNFPDPWPGGWWRLRDIVDYEKIACMSLFTLAARYHDLFISNKIKLGRDAIERGKTEPPFAWLVPPDQHDARTAAEMLSILHATGIEVHQAEDEFLADRVRYPAGTYILYCSQPYRSHLNDMMERQVYPNRSYYQGGPPEAPYDMAGWTLPLQMGVRSVSVNQQFESRARKLEAVTLPQGKVIELPQEAGGYVLKAGSNDNYRLINRLFKEGIDFKIISLPDQLKDKTGIKMSYGSLFIPDVNEVDKVKPQLLEGISTSLIGVQQASSQVKAACSYILAPRLGLYQPWTASIDEGWTRLVLDNFEFEYTSLHNSEIRAGNLRNRYDCLILPSVSSGSIIKGRAVDTTEPQYVGGIGSEGIIMLQNFVQDGGTLICIDSSCNLPIEYFNIPVRNIISNKASKEFFCPGSILRIWVDNKHPVGYGTPEWISGYFARSQAFELIEESGNGNNNPRGTDIRFPARVVARYSDTVLLESGWIRGKELIVDKPAIVEVQYGRGKIILIGFRVQHRAQSHGTFRLLFNAILYSTIDPIS